VNHEAFALASRVFDAVDRKDVEAFSAFLTDDCRFVYANADPVTGRPAIREAVAAFFAMVDGMTHEHLQVWRDGDVIVCRIDVSYLRKDGHHVRIPAVTLWQMRGDRICDYQIFNDLSPVFR